MSLKINRYSEAYKRVSSAGFHINRAEVIRNKWQKRSFLMRSYSVFVYFTCVCGTEEILYISNYEFYGEKIPFDAADHIEKTGALDPEHLRQDGYTEEQIKQIRAVYH